MRCSYSEIGETAIGWWLFFSGNLILAVVTISVLLFFKMGFDLRLAIPILLKWEIFITVFSLIIANVLHLHKYFISRILPVKGFVRITLLYLPSFWFAILIFSYTSFLFPFVRMWNLNLESPLGFVMLFLLFFRMRAQRNINDPKGPKLRLPIEDFNKSKFKPFGVFHPGVDFEKEIGTPVYAVADGKVAVSWPYGMNGNMVKIKHEDKFSTAYTHLNEITVNCGQMVKEGDLIGYTGNTGHSFTPHLHFEVRYRNRVTDPQKYLKEFKLKDEKFKKKKGQKKKSKK